MAEEVKRLNRIRAAKAVHEKKTQERKAVTQLTKASYLKEKDNPVLVDILTKAKSFMAYNLKLAQDGIGVKKNGLEMETYFIKPSERVSYLDKAAGIQQLIDYIDRQFLEPKPTVEVEEANPTD